jgi:predicted transcriptional regulator
MINVLEIIQSGEDKPTRIMYQANLSHQVIKEVLDDLVNQELISEKDLSSIRQKRDKRTKKMYEITLKGQKVLRYYHNSRSLVQVLG